MILISFGGFNLKIVYVVPVLAPYAIPRFQELAKIDGVEVHVIVEKATSSDRIGWKFEEIEGVKTYLLKKNYSHKFLKNNKNGNYEQDEEHIFPVGIRKIINKINPDVVIVCNASQLLMLLGPRKYKLGIIIEDTLRADEGKKPINKFIKKFLLKIVDFYCPFSDDSINYLNTYGVKDKIICSSWSIDSKDFSQMIKNEKITFVKEKKLNEDKIKFLIIANLIKRKGICEFLNSWKELPKEKLSSFELLIAGEGPERNNIENVIKQYNLDNIALLGHVEYSDIKRYLQVVDVFVLPTLEDLNSLSVYEALAASKPLLISKYNGSKFLVIENKNGFIFDPYNMDDTINKLIIISNANLTEMSKFSGELSKKYTNKVVMNKFYNDLINLYSI